MAAGLTIRRENLDAFRERFGGIARDTLTPEDLGPEQRVDLEIGLHEITYELERLCRAWTAGAIDLRADRRALTEPYAATQMLPRYRELLLELL